MTQQERLLYLIQYLIKENGELRSIDIPAEDTARKRFLRTLMNVRPPRAVTNDFLKIQDEYLQEEKNGKGICGRAT